MTAPIKLPMDTIVELTYAYIFTNLGSLCRLCGPWIAICLLCDAAVRAVGATGPTGAMVAASSAKDAPLAVAIVAIAVAWHRAILLGEPVPWLPRFWRNEARYFWIGCLISIVVALPIALSQITGFALVLRVLGGHLLADFIVTSFFMLACSIAAALIFMRLQLALPAAALGDRFGLTASIGATSGNTRRLIAMWFLVLPPCWIPSMISGLLHLFLRLTGSLDPGGWIGHLLATGLEMGAWAIGTVMVVAMLSYSYQILHRPPAQAAVAAG